MITQTKFYKKHSTEIETGLVWGLGFGLVMGLAPGLAPDPSGLASGLVSGPVIGLILGLISGLVFGLDFGLVSGLTSVLVSSLTSGLVVIILRWTSAFPFLGQFKSIAFLFLGILILIEIFYWLDKERPKGKIKTSFVLKKKFEATCEVLLGLSGISQIYILIREVNFQKYFPEILKWVGYIGAGLLALAIVIGLVYLWIQLNKLKYRK